MLVAKSRPQVAHILETSLYVEDLAISRDFYRRILGFTVLGEDHRMCAMEVPAGGVLLLFKRGGSTQPSVTPGGTIPQHDGGGRLHVCFAIPLLQLDEWTDHLTENGVEVESRVVQERGGVSIYFRDPDRHCVEVATPGLWQNY
jgi:catechol 2,3-dioxygenase-like lactoylglutathione lyase family enzyme